MKLLLYYIHYNYTIQLYKRQVFLRAHSENNPGFIRVVAIEAYPYK